YDQGGDWSDKGISGVDRFVNRTFDLFKHYEGKLTSIKSNDKYDLNSMNDDEKKVYRKVNQTLKKFNEEVENFRFNTAVASLMELLNELKVLENCRDEIKYYVLLRFAFMLASVAPHLGEECWQLLGNDKSIYLETPKFIIDEKALIEENVNIAVQVKGKLRATISVPINSEPDFVKSIIEKDDKVMKFVNDKTIVKEIFVKNKIYNIVVK
ncbi:MAG: class I tRNA ligase family protein, partial [Ignavibacteria bacterium]|nr:class I tRNA ligase family protein [Ignavibacteria bacterium]